MVIRFMVEDSFVSIYTLWMLFVREELQNFLVRVLFCLTFDSMKKDDFIVFDMVWSASEELRLLDAISEYGYGNW